jgi:vacuolar-type H+-ATPase subunit H
LSRTADSAAEYASDIKDRVSDAASPYTAGVGDFAQDARRNISEHTSRLTQQAQSTLESGMNRVLRDQPLAVVMAGLAAGAAVAAAFPTTEIEVRTWGPAGESVRRAAEKAAERVKDAAGKAGERLKSAAEERGLTTEGLKELAGEVTDTFTNAVSGKPEDQTRGTTALQSPAISRGQSFEAGQDWSASNPSPSMARPDIGPRQGNR